MIEDKTKQVNPWIISLVFQKDQAIKNFVKRQENTLSLAALGSVLMQARHLVAEGFILRTFTVMSADTGNIVHRSDQAETDNSTGELKVKALERREDEIINELYALAEKNINQVQAAKFDRLIDELEVVRTDLNKARYEKYNR